MGLQWSPSFLPAGQAVLEGELDRLIPLCAERTLGAAHSEHRAHAVAALESLAAYPYRLLHPFRGQVHAAISIAVMKVNRFIS